jgi:hypothetical protein
MYQRWLTYLAFLVVVACATSGGSTGPTMGDSGNMGGANGHHDGPQGGMCCFSRTGCKSGREIARRADCPAGVTCFMQYQFCGTCAGEVWCAPYSLTPDASSDASSDGSEDAN